MSLPALQEWATSLIRTQIRAAMTFPRALDVPFGVPPMKYSARAGFWPRVAVFGRVSDVILPSSVAAPCAVSATVTPTQGGAEGVGNRVRGTYEADVAVSIGAQLVDPQLEPPVALDVAFPLFDAQQVRFSVFVQRKDMITKHPFWASRFPSLTHSKCALVLPPCIYSVLAVKGAHSSLPPLSSAQRKSMGNHQIPEESRVAAVLQTRWLRRRCCRSR